MGAEHLKGHQWKPGQSGNPAGRPKRVSFEAWVEQILDEEVPGTSSTRREALARVFVDSMLKRNAQLIREYLAREWAVVNKHELTGRGGGALEVAGESEWDALRSALPSLRERKAKPRTNGSGGPKPRSNGSA